MAVKVTASAAVQRLPTRDKPWRRYVSPAGIVVPLTLFASVHLWFQPFPLTASGSWASPARAWSAMSPPLGRLGLDHRLAPASY
jgi:hypothetical protein